MQAFERLKSNARVDWLVRLVAYDPANPRLRVDKLTALGAPAEDYTFVADYEELRGHTVEDAARLAGGAISPGQGVSAILFRLDRRPLFPASVRGMLQVIQEIDKRRAGEPSYKVAALESRLAPAESEALANRRVVSWAWSDYRALFPTYDRVFRELKSQNISAFAHIGHIGRDWCEPGCSRLAGHRTSLRPDTMTLELADGTPYAIERFGVRVFPCPGVPRGGAVPPNENLISTRVGPAPPRRPRPGEAEGGRREAAAENARPGGGAAAGVAGAPAAAARGV